MVTEKDFDKLSDRQKLFCQYVAEGINPSQAAVKAGYSEKGNRSRACRLMQRDDIQAGIRKVHEEMKTPPISAIRERKIWLTKVMRTKLPEYLEVKNGNIQLILDILKAQEDGVLRFDYKKKTNKTGNTTTKISIRMSNPMKAIQELNKMEGVYPKQTGKKEKTGEKLYEVEVVYDEKILKHMKNGANPIDK